MNFQCQSMYTLSGLILTMLMSSCAPAVTQGDPCELSDRNLSVGVLIENSSGDYYNRCLLNRAEVMLEALS